MASKFEYYDTGRDSQGNFSYTNWLAQTFTAESNHSVSSVKIYVKDETKTGAVWVSIRATTVGGVPTGSDLCSGYFTTPGNNTWYWGEATMGTPYNLTSGTKYAICVRATGSNVMDWGDDATSPSYSGGAYFYSSTSGSSWSDQDTNKDLHFEIWGDVSSQAYTKDLSDTLTLSESIKKDYSTIKSETITLSDNIQKAINKLFSDTLNLVQFALIDSCNNDTTTGTWILYTGSNGTGAGQTFACNVNSTLDSCKFYIARAGSPTGNVYAEIYAMTGTYGTNGKPTGSPLATSDNVDISTIPLTATLKTFTFSGANRISLSASTYYVAVVRYLDGNSTNYLSVLVNNGAHSGNAVNYSNQWNYWTNTDTIFYVYGIVSNSDTIIKSIGKSISDSLNLTDNISRAVSFIKTETLNLSDNISKSIGYIRNFTDTLNLSESISKSIFYIKEFIDTLNLSDNVNKATSFIKAETLNLTDSIQKSLSLLKTETLTLSDNISKGIGVIKSEIITLSEDFAKNFVKLLTLTDTLNLSDNISKSVGYFKELIDTLNLSDNISKSFATVKTELLTLTDTVRKFINGFEAIWRKAVRVTSTSWTKRDKPSTSWTKRTKPSTIWRKRDKPWD